MHSERRHERPLRRPGSGSGPTTADRNGRYRSAADANPPPLKRAPSFHDEKQESPDDSPVPFPCLAHTSGGERCMPPRSGDSVGIRTRDPQLRRLLLYPTELRNHFVKPSAEPNTGPKLSRGPKRSNDAPPSVAAVRANAETKVMKKSKTEIRTTKLFVFTDRTHHRVRPDGRADEPIPPISGGQLADWEILCIFAGFQSPKGSGVIRLLN